MVLKNKLFIINLVQLFGTDQVFFNSWFSNRYKKDIATCTYSYRKKLHIYDITFVQLLKISEQV